MIGAFSHLQAGIVTVSVVTLAVCSVIRTFTGWPRRTP